MTVKLTLCQRHCNPVNSELEIFFAFISIINNSALITYCFHCYLWHFLFFLNHLWSQSTLAQIYLTLFAIPHKTMLWSLRFLIHEPGMLEISNLIVKSHSWQEVRPFWLHSRQNICTQWRSWYMAWQNISIRLSWMAYFSLGPHTTHKLYEMAKQFFYFTMVSVFLSSRFSSVKNPDALPSQCGIVGNPYRSPHSGPPCPSFQKRLFFSFLCTYLWLCVFMQADICHKKGKRPNRLFELPNTDP